MNRITWFYFRLVVAVKCHLQIRRFESGNSEWAGKKNANFFNVYALHIRISNSIASYSIFSGACVCVCISFKAARDCPNSTKRILCIYKEHLLCVYVCIFQVFIRIYFEEIKDRTTFTFVSFQ